MKKMNLLVMSLVSAAALSFTSCSDSEDLANDKAGQEKVDGFYMTLSIQTPKANGTRTVLPKDSTETASAAESDVTSGTIYLVDANGNIVFHTPITESDWKAGKPTQGNDGSTQLKIAVEDVVAGATYKVYFLANAEDAKPWEDVFSSKTKFANPYVENSKFAMFNQNDKTVDGNAYTVVFTNDNKKSTSAAKIQYEGKESAIKIERLTARIDEPTSNATKIAAYTKEDATPAEKKAMEDAVNKVKSVEMTGYAISNLADKSYIMQHWTGTTGTTLKIPSDITYYQKKDEFGTATKLENGDFFTAPTTEEGKEKHKDYVFENNSSDAATAMYFEYKVTLYDMKNADFPEDGTFYRYNNVIYKSFEDIYKAYKDVKGLFDGKTAKEMKALLTAAKTAKTADGKSAVEDKLDEFRKTYQIEVFNCGKTYYKQIIKDNNIGYDNAIQRNSIYRLKVNNIFNVGAQVPNGTPDKEGLFYLDVTVSVNPWVLNTQEVELK